MIRMSRLADYGVVLMTQLAARPEVLTTAPELSLSSGLPVPTVSKILKALVQDGVLESHRGNKGGYALVRRAEEVSVAEIIRALEGPIALTECVGAEEGACDFEALCPTRTNWQKINDAIHRALDEVSLADMMGPMAAFIPSFERRTQQTREL